MRNNFYTFLVIPQKKRSVKKVTASRRLLQFLIVFLSTHVVGVKEHGFKYFKQFMGPVGWLTPLMLPIEIISHLSRPLSLTFRLFGNIKGEDIVLLVVLFLVPYFVPLPVFFLMIFTSLVQTLVFMLLSMMYIAGAMEEGH